jgi:hypothetical protein
VKTYSLPPDKAAKKGVIELLEALIEEIERGPEEPHQSAEIMLSLPQAARCSALPKPVSANTIHSWIRNGVTTATGKVRLKAVRMGRRWLVSREALQRFLAATNGAAVGSAS